MREQLWQQTHLADLAQRLDWLKDLPDGTLHEQVSGLHQIRIIKHVGQVHFYFLDPATGTLEGPMSRIELDRPLRLLAEYTQAAMLTLLWKLRPERVCLLGLAGGRLSLIFYHYFPDVTIDNVDIDRAVVTIAAKYFGLCFDTRQTVAIQDARAYLRALTPATVYDIIVMDAFRDESDNLNHLATAQFYGECRARLAPGGVLCANMLKSDPLFFEKARTFQESFRHVLVSEHKRGVVLFGSTHHKPAGAEIAQKAAALQHAHGFEFPFVERAATLITYRELAASHGWPLRDLRPLNDELKRET
jgi:spermidine synthase